MTSSQVTPGLYRHYKGGQYEVIGVGEVEATNEPVVLYRSLQDKGGYSAGSLWTRPVSVWLEMVEVHGKKIPRFEKINSEIPFTLKDVFYICLFPFIVYIANITVEALFLDWSNHVGFDSYLHFCGGASIAFCSWYVLRILKKNNVVKIKNALLKLLCIMALVALAALTWEIYEFVWDRLFGTCYQPSNWDTMKDMILGLTGGTITGFLLLLKN